MQSQFDGHVASDVSRVIDSLQIVVRKLRGGEHSEVLSDYYDDIELPLAAASATLSELANKVGDKYGS